MFYPVMSFGFNCQTKEIINKFSVNTIPCIFDNMTSYKLNKLADLLFNLDLMFKSENREIVESDERYTEYLHVRDKYYELTSIHYFPKNQSIDNTLKTLPLQNWANIIKDNPKKIIFFRVNKP